MLENASKEVIISTTEAGALRKVKKFKTLFMKLAGKGVKIKIAAPMNKDVEESLDEVKNYVKVKSLSGIDSRFCLVDRKEALFFISNDKDVHETYDSAVWISTPFFAEAFGTMFDSVWKDGK